MTTTSTVCVYKKDILSHRIMKDLTHTEVHKIFHYHIIPINAALRSHWTLSNSETSPRIWTCVTTPDPTHMCVESGARLSKLDHVPFVCVCECTQVISYMYLIYVHQTAHASIVCAHETKPVWSALFLCVL